MALRWIIAAAICVIGGLAVVWLEGRRGKRDGRDTE